MRVVKDFITLFWYIKSGNQALLSIGKEQKGDKEQLYPETSLPICRFLCIPVVLNAIKAHQNSLEKEFLPMEVWSSAECLHFSEVFSVYLHLDMLLLSSSRLNQ